MTSEVISGTATVSAPIARRACAASWTVNQPASAVSPTTSPRSRSTCRSGTPLVANTSATCPGWRSTPRTRTNHPLAGGWSNRRLRRSEGSVPANGDDRPPVKISAMSSRMVTAVTSGPAPDPANITAWPFTLVMRNPFSTPVMRLRGAGQQRRHFRPGCCAEAFGPASAGRMRRRAGR